MVIWALVHRPWLGLKLASKGCHVALTPSDNDFCEGLMMEILGLMGSQRCCKCQVQAYTHSKSAATPRAISPTQKGLGGEANLLYIAFLNPIEQKENTCPGGRVAGVVADVLINPGESNGIPIEGCLVSRNCRKSICVILCVCKDMGTLGSVQCCGDMLSTRCTWARRERIQSLKNTKQIGCACSILLSIILTMKEKTQIVRQSTQPTKS